MMQDLVIRGAVVIDGLGNEPVSADVAVKAGRITMVGETGEDSLQTIDANGLTLAPGIVDLHTHYDAQITWDATLSPSPSLGVTSAVMGNCGFGIVPSPPPVRDLILRNLSVVEGMNLDSLRAGVRWKFEEFSDYISALRNIGPYINVAVLAGHSVIRTAVMGEDASLREQATLQELELMGKMVAEAMASGAIGFASSYSLNHSGYNGVPMPSTISGWSEFDFLIKAMGEHSHGIVQLASGPRSIEDLEAISAKHGRAMFLSTGMAMFNEQEPYRAIDIFNACAAANAKGRQVYVQIPCQPLSFDFTMANAYPFYSHDGFDQIKAYNPEQLKTVFREDDFRRRFRASLANPQPGMIFQGNWERVTIAIPTLKKNSPLANQSIEEVARTQNRDPLDVILDLSLEEDLQTTFIGQFLNVGDAGVNELLQHESGVVALSDAGAHLTFMCEAGFGLHFLAKWVRERGNFTLVHGIQRLTSHPADLYGLIDRGRIVPGAYADLMLFDPDQIGVTAAERIQDLPGGGSRTIRQPLGLHGVFVNGAQVFDGEKYLDYATGPGMVLDHFRSSKNMSRVSTEN
jgi:N-acyl-D-aspartate/D-glutamate deacylase